MRSLASKPRPLACLAFGLVGVLVLSLVGATALHPLSHVLVLCGAEGGHLEVEAARDGRCGFTHAHRAPMSTAYFSSESQGGHDCGVCEDTKLASGHAWNAAPAGTTPLPLVPVAALAPLERAQHRETPRPTLVTAPGIASTVLRC